MMNDTSSRRSIDPIWSRTHLKLVNFGIITLSLLCLLGASLVGVFVAPAKAASTTTTVSLAAYVNNQGIGTAAGQANFDGYSDAYPASQVPAGGPVTLGGVTYQFPSNGAGHKDNVAALGQTITLPAGQYAEAALLTASSFGPAEGTVTVTYTDGTTTQAPLTIPDWYGNDGSGVVTSSFRYTPTGTDQHPVYLFARTVSLDATKTVSTLTLPTLATPAPNKASAHVFALSLLTATAQLWASPSGQGTTCSQSAPCSLTTAQHQADLLAPTVNTDVTVNLLAGTYHLTQPLSFTSADSGVNGHSINYVGASPRPTISGSTAITGWTQTDATHNIWSATVPSTLATRQLYVNGVRAQVAQGPLPVTLTQTATGYTASAATLASWGNPADIEFVYTQGKGLGSWTEPRCRVASIAGTTITMSQPCWDNSTKRVKALGLGNNLSGSPTHIENAYELLTQPGQWYLNMSSHRLSYIPLPGQNIQTADVEAPTLQTLVQGNGTLNAPVHNLSFRNLQFAYATWLGPSSPDGFSEVQANYTLTGQGAAQTEGTCEYSTPQGSCPYGAWTQTPANIAFQATQEVTFASDSFTHLGAAGLGLEYGSQNNLVYGSEFTDISGTGLQLGNVNDAHPSDVGADTREITSWNTIADNWFHNDAVEYHGGSGIFAGYTQHTLITHNQLNALPYDGIDFGWGGWHTNSAFPTADTNINADNTISNNLIFDFKTVLADGGGIYTNGLQGSSFADGLFETGNIVYAQHNSNWALYNDQGSAYVTLNGNAEWDAPLGWGGCAPVGHILLENNYFADFVGTKYCSPNPIDVTQTNDTKISDNPTASALPASLLSAAGLEPAYQGLVTTTAPEVDLFSPNTGTASAPTSVLIDGSGFVANTTQVAFVGGVAATQVTVLSPNFLVATAPTGAVLTAVSVTTPASPTFAPTAHYVFINQTTGLALDDGGAVSQSGADMFEYADQAATNTNQQFTIVAVGSGAYRITAVSDGLSLDDRGMTTANAIMGQSSYTGSSNQQWRFYTTGNGSYEVLDSAGFALDGRGSTTNSTSVDQYSYNGSPNLQWRIIQVSS